MARDFTKNTSNNTSLGNGIVNAILSGAAKIAVHLWMYADTYNTGASDNRMLNGVVDGSSSGLIIAVNGSGANKVLFVSCKPSSAEAGSSRSGVSNLATGQWNAVGTLINIASDSITIYVNGTQDATGSNSFTATSYTPGTATSPDRIGGGTSLGTANQFDGRLAEVAIWVFNSSTPGLTADEWKALYAGTPAMQVRPVNLAAYWPLWGIHSPETELIAARTATITGSLPKSAHPPNVLDLAVFGDNGTGGGFGTFTDPQAMKGTKVYVPTAPMIALASRVHRKAIEQENQIEFWYERSSVWYKFNEQPVVEPQDHPVLRQVYKQPSTLELTLPDNFGLLTPENLNSAYNYNGSTYEPLVDEARKVQIFRR